MYNHKSIILPVGALISLLIVSSFMFVTDYVRALGPAPVSLGSAGDFGILAKSGISTTGATLITGDIGISPAGASSVTGFGLVLDASNQFATSSLVTGKAYAADYAAPTPTTMTTAVSNMEAAYTDAAGRPAGVGAFLNIGAGTVTTQTIVPGVYTWNSAVTITGDVTLSGGANDVWIFQIAGTLDMEVNNQIILSGGAQAKNIFWQVAGAVTIKSGSRFEGIILAQTNIAMQAGAVLHGRALAQTAVTLIANTVTAPTLSSTKAITAFTIPGQVGGTVINEGSHTVAVTVPSGTVVTALIPTITVTGTSVLPNSGVAQNFTSPVTYTVTAADSSTQAYIVTVTILAGGGGGNTAPVIDYFNGPVGFVASSSQTWSMAARDPDGTALNLNVSWGDSTPASTATRTAGSVGAAVTASFTHIYTAAGVYTITATAIDSSSAQAQTTLMVTVTAAPPGGGGGNTAPVIDYFNGPVSFLSSSNQTWSLAARDPDGTALNVNISWGDSAPASTASLTATVAGQVVTTDINHTYSSVGVYTITATVLDSSSAQAQTTLVVTVVAAPPGGGNPPPAPGGGGGSGGFYCPSIQSETVSVSLADATTPPSDVVKVLLTYGSNITHVWLSNSSDFSEAVYSAIAPQLQWRLAAVDGDRNVYVKFRSNCGDTLVKSVAAGARNLPSPRVLGAECINLAAEQAAVKTEDIKVVNRWRGQFVMRDSDGGDLWYVDVNSGRRYYIPSDGSALAILKHLAGGATSQMLSAWPIGTAAFVGSDSDGDGLPDAVEESIGTSPNSTDTDGDGYIDGLEVINNYQPSGSGRQILNLATAKQYQGRLWLQTDGHGELWYIKPSDQRRYYLPAGSDLLQNVLRQLSSAITTADLQKIKVADQVGGLAVAQWSGCYPPPARVLGATSSRLPRTGLPAVGWLVLPILLSYPWWRRYYRRALTSYYGNFTS